MEYNKDILNKDKSNFENNWWKPAIVFYAKATSWIILPLLVAVILNKYISKSINGQIFLIFFIVIAFLITCYGIFREIKQYNKTLENNKK